VLHATVSEGLAQGPYVAARVGLEPPDRRHQTYHWATTPHIMKVVMKFLVDENNCSEEVLLTSPADW